MPPILFKMKNSPGFAEKISDGEIGKSQEDITKVEGFCSCSRKCRMTSRFLSKLVALKERKPETKRFKSVMVF
jgi:hypothetical protein